jgi:hypothetical protein
MHCEARRGGRTGGERERGGESRCEERVGLRRERGEERERRGEEREERRGERGEERRDDLLAAYAA